LSRLGKITDSRDEELREFLFWSGLFVLVAGVRNGHLMPMSTRSKFWEKAPETGKLVNFIYSNPSKWHLT